MTSRIQFNRIFYKNNHTFPDQKKIIGKYLLINDLFTIQQGVY